MELSREQCYRAISARDRRFDGLFFVGVTTTRIYCRPVCSARTPRRDRCRFFASAALAERAGFRPCLKCRPELAPGQAPIDGAGRVALAVAARLRGGALNERAALEPLAEELGLSSRQLRRIVKAELGVTPIELAQTQRLLTAKQLLCETRLPVVAVAHAAGFQSLRRFNALFRARYRLTPTRLRRSAGRSATDGPLRLTLSYRPPLDWPRLLAYLAARAVPGVERVDGGAYARTVALEGCAGWLCVRHDGARAAIQVEVAEALAPVLGQLLARVRALLDLDARPDVIAGHLSQDAVLCPLVRESPGLRVPGALDGFEAAWRAVVEQQISLRAARTVAGRIIERFGAPIATPVPGLKRLTPDAAALAAAREQELGRAGIPAVRARCVRELAKRVADGSLRLEPGGLPETVLPALRACPGIGPWTSEHVAMRALHWPDALPAGDLVLGRVLGLRQPRRVLERAEAWRPWRAYAARHLWTYAGERR